MYKCVYVDCAGVWLHYITPVVCACVKCVLWRQRCWVSERDECALSAHLSQWYLCSECTYGTALCALRASCAVCSCDCSGCTWMASLLWAEVSGNHQHMKHQQHLKGTASIISLSGFIQNWWCAYWRMCSVSAGKTRELKVNEQVSRGKWVRCHM